MGVITISRGSYSYGKEIAEKTAKRLRYECLSREAILETLDEFNMPEIKLIQALEDIPSILDRMIHGKRRYMTHTRLALLHRLREGDVVYHGFAGHFFLERISHVLKVLITANMEDRIKIVMERHHLSRKKASRFVTKIDDQRRKWGKTLYGIDPWDPHFYDLSFHIDQLRVEDVVENICRVSRLKQFQMTPESEKKMNDMFTAFNVELLLLNVKPSVEVYAENKFVYLKPPAPLKDDSEIVMKMDEIMKMVPGIQGIKVVGKRAARGRRYNFDVKGCEKLMMDKFQSL